MGRFYKFLVCGASEPESVSLAPKTLHAEMVTGSTLTSDVDVPNKLSSGSPAVIATQTCDAATTDKAAS